MDSRAKSIKVSALAALLAATLYCFADLRDIAALLLAASAHELGHIAALLLLGLRITGFRAELRGLCIEYAGYAGRGAEALAAAAGPAAGLLLWALLSTLSRACGGAWLELTAGLSLLLSVFNLLPALPLDGGRVFLSLACAAFGDAAGRRLSEAVGLLTGVALTLLGLWAAWRGMGLALAAAALWLLLYRRGEPGLVNAREII